jgi:type I restriction-modification system DNA methylase subunit
LGIGRTERYRNKEWREIEIKRNERERDWEINKAIRLIKTNHAFYFVALLLHNTVSDKKLTSNCVCMNVFAE